MRANTIRADNLMADTNQLVTNILTKISHHTNLSVLYLTQNVLTKTTAPG